MRTEPRCEQRKALEYLSELKGKKVWANVGKVSSSGMTRYISLYVITERDKYVGDGKYIPEPYIQKLDYFVAGALGLQLTEWGVRIGGCGMDMIFAMITHINWAVWKYDHPGQELDVQCEYAYCFDSNNYGRL